jgi:1-acyl-sn-glycerol-3-phosphate acyltransferase
VEEWQYDSARDLDKNLVDGLRDFPREPSMWTFATRSAAGVLIRICLKVFHRFRVTGLENISQESAFVLVANHSSHWDAICLISMLPFHMRHRIFPAAAADYFFTALPRVMFSSIIVNALPFHRTAGPQQSLKICQQLLKTPGNVLILFPEGTRSTTGALGEFKPGIGLLLRGCAVPVLPCAIKGAFESWPKGRRLPRLTRLSVVVGKPMNFEQVAPGKGGAKEIALQLQGAVQDLLEAKDE